MPDNCRFEAFFEQAWPPFDDGSHFIQKSGNKAPEHLVIDYNLYYCPNNRPRWQIPGSKLDTQFTQWQAQGWDGHGQMANPMFIDDTYESGGVSSGGDKTPTMGTGNGLDLHLKARSPARNTGTNSADIGNEDIDAQPRFSSEIIDIGADEIKGQ